MLIGRAGTHCPRQPGDRDRSPSAAPITSRPTPVGRRPSFGSPQSMSEPSQRARRARRTGALSSHAVGDVRSPHGECRLRRLTGRGWLDGAPRHPPAVDRSRVVTHRGRRSTAPSFRYPVARKSSADPGSGERIGRRTGSQDWGKHPRPKESRSGPEGGSMERLVRRLPIVVVGGILLGACTASGANSPDTTPSRVTSSTTTAPRTGEATSTAPTAAPSSAKSTAATPQATTATTPLAASPSTTVPPSPDPPITAPRATAPPPTAPPTTAPSTTPTTAGGGGGGIGF